MKETTKKAEIKGAFESKRDLFVDFATFVETAAQALEAEALSAFEVASNQMLDLWPIASACAKSIRDGIRETIPTESFDKERYFFLEFAKTVSALKQSLEENKVQEREFLDAEFDANVEKMLGYWPVASNSVKIVLDNII